jgi:hypothetical protein
MYTAMPFKSTEKAQINKVDTPLVPAIWRNRRRNGGHITELLNYLINKNITAV